MKLKNISLIGFVLMTIILASCDSMISDVDAPTTSPKLVVNSYISPDDDTIRVRVQYSRPLYSITSYYNSYEYPPVTDAQVSITDGNSTINLIYNAFELMYITTDLTIEPGKTYSLVVSTPRNENVTASCTVPALEPPSIEITNIESTPSSYGYKNISFRFQDFPGQGNYYRVMVGISYQTGPNPSDVYFTPMYLVNGEEFVSDINKDGEFFVFKTDNIYDGNLINLVFFISITDENYFSFHKSVNSFQDDNPFSEPTPVYTNIEGGVGVFAAFKGKMTFFNIK
ncbi:MAG: hypothetical protein CVT92_03575 [Bacteroidetes bacterium HGW-Bacteroidetes-1]|jgi:hypothetical protein|nr:MAG: hypothetical protein CVT92_03575 [Bacteroidetes bacterium HGW-Bacteroidetes-1]